MTDFDAVREVAAINVGDVEESMVSAEALADLDSRVAELIRAGEMSVKDVNALTAAAARAARADRYSDAYRAAADCLFGRIA